MVLAGNHLRRIPDFLAGVRMTAQLKRVTRRVRNEHPWPAHWIVSFTWEFKGKVLESRKYEVALKGHPSVWYVFDRHVINPEIDKDWIDAFSLRPYGAFTSFRPEQVIKVRARREAKAKVVTSEQAPKVIASDDEQAIAA